MPVELLAMRLAFLSIAITPLCAAFHGITAHRRSAAPALRRRGSLASSAFDSQDFSIIDAIEQRGVFSPKDRSFRVTASDIAAERGYDLQSASSALARLSASLEGAMEVTEAGQMLYVFPRSSRRKLKRQQRVQSTLAARVRARALLVAQASVGLMLISSAAFVQKLQALTGGGRDARQEQRRLSFRGEVRALGAYIYRVGRESHASGGATGDNVTLEDDAALAPLTLACFDFLLGGGGVATEALEEQQWAAIAQAIRANKGACVADQLRPFLLDVRGANKYRAAGGVQSPRQSPRQSPWISLDHLMLPVVARFDGRPIATEAGDIVYVFPELLPTATRDVKYGTVPRTAPIVRGVGDALKAIQGPKAATDYLEEPLAPFMRVESSVPVFAVAAANWAGIFVLGAVLGPFQLAMRAGQRGLGALAIVNLLYGGLLVNAACWLVLPAGRRFSLLLTNFGVRRRNAARRAMARSLLGPAQSPALSRRLRSAKKLAQRGRNDLRQRDVTYTTARSLLEQSGDGTHADPSLAAFDAKLRRKAGGRPGPRSTKRKGSAF